MGDCKCDKFCYCPGLTARTLAQWPDSREIPSGSDPLAMTASAGPLSLKNCSKGLQFISVHHPLKRHLIPFLQS